MVTPRRLARAVATAIVMGCALVVWLQYLQKPLSPSVVVARLEGFDADLEAAAEWNAWSYSVLVVRNRRTIDTRLQQSRVDVAAKSGDRLNMYVLASAVRAGVLGPGGMEAQFDMYSKVWDRFFDDPLMPISDVIGALVTCAHSIGRLDDWHLDQLVRRSRAFAQSDASSACIEDVWLWVYVMESALLPEEVERMRFFCRRVLESAVYSFAPGMDAVGASGEAQFPDSVATAKAFMLIERFQASDWLDMAALRRFNIHAAGRSRARGRVEYGPGLLWNALCLY